MENKWENAEEFTGTVDFTCDGEDISGDVSVGELREAMEELKISSWYHVRNKENGEDKNILSEDDFIDW